MDEGEPKLEYVVRVRMDDTCQDMMEVLAMVGELEDLVPEWSQMEAEELSRRIYEKASKMIQAERRK